MPDTKSRLRPYQVFKNEVTGVNQLYWTTDYVYERAHAILRVLAETSDRGSDARVDLLWASAKAGQRSQTTVSLASFHGMLGENLDAIRRTSVLYLCSAFENALSGYFILCTLYQPKTLLPAWSHPACPALVGKATEFELLKKAATDAAGADPKKALLKGAYAKRLSTLDGRFSLSLPLATLPVSNLDAHYAIRNKIAHDQGLQTADDPGLSIAEILAGRVNVTESMWKTMIDNFMQTIEAVDKAVRSTVVSDHGACLAVGRILARTPGAGVGLTIGKIRHTASTDWRVEFTLQDIVDALKHLGRQTTIEKAVFRRKLK